MAYSFKGRMGRPPMVGCWIWLLRAGQPRLEHAGRGRQAADRAVRHLAMAVPAAQIARLMHGRRHVVDHLARGSGGSCPRPPARPRPKAGSTCGSHRMVNTVACHSPSLALKPYCAASDVCGTWQSLQVATRAWLLCCQVTYCVVITWQFMQVSGRIAQVRRRPGDVEHEQPHPGRHAQHQKRRQPPRGARNRSAASDRAVFPTTARIVFPLCLKIAGESRAPPTPTQRSRPILPRRKYMSSPSRSTSTCSNRSARRTWHPLPAPGDGAWHVGAPDELGRDEGMDLVNRPDIEQAPQQPRASLDQHVRHAPAAEFGKQGVQTRGWPRLLEYHDFAARVHKPLAIRLVRFRPGGDQDGRFPRGPHQLASRGERCAAIQDHPHRHPWPGRAAPSRAGHRARRSLGRRESHPRARGGQYVSVRPVQGVQLRIALRGRVDAILVGRGTAERDDPLLTAQPVRATGGDAGGLG